MWFYLISAVSICAILVKRFVPQFIPHFVPVSVIEKIITNKLAKRYVKIYPRRYVLEYPYGIKWYKICIPRRRGVCLIDTITDSDGKDITVEIAAFMGPCHNFHGIPTTPKMLDHQRLTFSYLNGTQRTFEGDDVIIL